jgi:hypothetical protein
MSSLIDGHDQVQITLLHLLTQWIGNKLTIDRSHTNSRWKQMSIVEIFIVITLDLPMGPFQGISDVAMEAEAETNE